MVKYLKIILALSIIPQFFILEILRHYPQHVDYYYSENLYPIISKSIRFLSGWIPFSIGDVCYSFVCVITLVWLLKRLKSLRHIFRSTVLDIMCSASVIFFLFHMLWGLNYYRLPLHDRLGMSTSYSTEQLISTTELLVELSNTVHEQLTDSSNHVVNPPYAVDTHFQKSYQGYQKLSYRGIDLEVEPKSIKASLFSLPLTYMGFSGYLNPFTNESQIDILIPQNSLPMTINHEQAHQLGYAAENEANFIGFISSISNRDLYFKYSGYTFALKYCLNELYRNDQSTYTALLNTIRPGILKDYKARAGFWKTYKNPIEPYMKQFYNQFLKLNNQVKGIKSYNYVVGLIVNHYQL